MGGVKAEIDVVLAQEQFTDIDQVVLHFFRSVATVAPGVVPK